MPTVADCVPTEMRKPGNPVVALCPGMGPSHTVKALYERVRNKSPVRAHYGARSLSEAPKENARKFKIKAYLTSILPVCSYGEKNSPILWFFPLLLLMQRV